MPKTVENVTCKDIQDLLDWSRANGLKGYERIAKRADNDSFGALKTIAEMINAGKGPWASADRAEPPAA